MTVKPRAVFDIECYRHFFLVCFQAIDSGKQKHFELYEGHPLDRQGIIRILRNHTIIGFNSNTYDVPMLRLSLRLGTTNTMLKDMSDAIITRNLKPWDCEREFNLPHIDWLDHIDLIEPAPSVNVGLKLYGGRLHSQKLQDLPIEPGAVITAHERPLLISYCYNDLAVTLDLYRHIEPQIQLREQMSEQYDIDLRSKADAQIAEAIIRKELERIRGDKLYRPDIPHDYSFKYEPPTFLVFKTKQMQDAFDTVCDATFKLKHTRAKDDEDAVSVGGVKMKVSGILMPPEIKTLRIKIGGSTYKMGIGGLHSTESKVSHFSDDETLLRDADVGAFYPQLLLVCGLFPEHLGPAFLDVYRTIRERRMVAKRAKDKVTDMTLKIVLNGTFGKLGSKWSFLYSPNLMLQVTITGQLVLLMLIEALELAGISVVSANTDGIVSKIAVDMVDEYNEIIKDWEQRTGFEMEFADYDMLYSRDVNNYLAVKTDGYVKQKGAFAFTGSKGSPAEKNPASYICIDAVIAYLTKGVPLEETIEWCPDVRRFLTVRRVTGGAMFNDQYLGKVVRWYYSKGSRSSITYAKNGNKVAKSDGAKPMMTLTGLPNDIDYDYYCDEARKMLGALGVL